MRIHCVNSNHRQKVCGRHHVFLVSLARQEAPIHLLIVLWMEQPPVELHAYEEGKKEC